MAIWVQQTTDRLTIRTVPVLGLVTTWSVAVGLFIPALLDWLGNNYRHPGSSFTYVIIALAVGLAMCSWRTLVVNTNRMYVAAWRRRACLRFRDGRIPIAEITRVRLVDRPRLGPLARVVLQFDTAADSLSLFFGWRWRGRLNDCRWAALLALKDRLDVHDETAAGLLKSASDARRPFQISLRRVLIATTLVAGVLASSKARHWSATDAQQPITALAACLVAGAALLYRPGSAITERFLPSLVAMYVPFVWIIFEIEPWGHISGLGEVFPWFPALWVQIFIRNGPNSELLNWLASGVILLEISIAFGCAARGWKWSIPCTIVLGLASTAWSFLLNAGIRA